MLALAGPAAALTIDQQRAMIRQEFFRYVGMLDLPLDERFDLAPGITCPNGNNPSERAVCRDPELSYLSGVMQVGYRAAVANSANAVASPEAQGRWLEVRNRCAQNVRCLDQAYRKRIADFVNLLR
ncbi:MULTISPECIES: lysozyme inhibitor LprI family protein [Burkholderia cepacia complex]|uniref:hypothetical protein n=1 Tax=Burkholderia cepacia complex TaxID=87882 RepID=UPI001CF4F7EB|nr:MULTISPECIES: hypothetical protein [Burkholderia cepacia complex]MCA8264830.1 hypothetical protein [Burkholderia vietnamiensis]